MPSSARLDVPVGIVPDYATFVRHVWSYEDQDCGRAVIKPPWVYSVLFEDTAEVGVALSLIEMIATPHGSARTMVEPRRVEIVMASGEDGVSSAAYEVRFADLQVLHLFLVMLGSQASVDMVAHQVGEFLMWTLGFRWV